ncbi:MAG TPA: lipopolysaccharide assembly protein LapA domain-containing protein [Candidatus Krumholzibacteria bacterium]
MSKVRNFFLIVLGTLAVIVMVQNAQPITFRFLNWSYQVSQLLLVVIVLVIGFLGGFVSAKMSRGSKEDEMP